MCRLGFRKPFLDPVDFTRSRKMVARDSTLTMLQGLSVLELCLVIAMKHLTEISDGETFNFEMVYNGMTLCMFVCVSVGLSVCWFVYISLLAFCVSVCLSVCQRAIGTKDYSQLTSVGLALIAF